VTRWGDDRHFTPLKRRTGLKRKTWIQPISHKRKADLLQSSLAIYRNDRGRLAEERVCAHCGNRFLVEPSYARIRGRKYCSLACTREAQAPRPATCEQCGKEFIPPNRGLGIGRFCSHRCHRDHQHATEPRRVEFSCLMCGTTFSRPISWVRKDGKPKYCSRPCAAQGRLREGSSGHRGPGWRRLAETIRERDERLCVRCGTSEAADRRHAVDHVIPWIMLRHSPSVANDPANLATLCARCHGIKTTVTEPRMFKGDFLSLVEFYGREIADRVDAQLKEAKALGLVA
jgi:5-methylcytosine-specific restriction endonuclease McrA